MKSKDLSGLESKQKVSVLGFVARKALGSHTRIS